jgi:PAS domain S-box-containing protein
VTDLAADKLSILHRYYDVFNRHDVEEWADLFHPEVTLVPVLDWAPPGTVYHGRAGMRSYAHEVFARMPRLRIEPPMAVREIGHQLLTQVSMDPGGNGSTEGARTFSALYTFKDGQIFTLDGFATEEEAIEAAQWRSEETFNLLFENTAEAVVLCDDEADFVDANAPAVDLYGMSIDELRGRTIFDLSAPDVKDALDEFWRAFLEHGQRSIESAIVSSDGERRPVELRAKADFVPGRHLMVIVHRPQVVGTTPPDVSAQPRLTPREREVFGLLALGFTGAEVAERLVLSPHTVRRHVEKGITRLHAKNRVQAIAIALTSGEIEL